MPHEHQRSARELSRNEPVRCAILTVSDTRTAATDAGGDRVQSILMEFGHVCSARGMVRDEPPEIAAAIDAWIAEADIDAIVITGGTGIARRDTTIEAIQPFIDIELPGFGELFRMISYQEVGSAAMLSRAMAGFAVRGGGQRGDTVIFAIPGSVNAVETAVRHLIGPELAHIAWERRK